MYTVPRYSGYTSGRAPLELGIPFVEHYIFISWKKKFFASSFYFTLSLITMAVLTDEQLSNLKLYKYSSIDKSFLTKYVLRHYWDVCIELFPLNMA